MSKERTPENELGLYLKYRVNRIDGKDSSGEKHENCRYFVLDLDHDPFARVALMAYSAACRTKFKKLSDDLNRIVVRLGRGEPLGHEIDFILRGRNEAK